MKTLNSILAFVALVMTAAAVFRWQAMARLRSEAPDPNPAVTADSMATGAVDDDSRAELESLRQQTKDLPGLRNEIMRLRAATNELAALQKENARLQEAKLTGAKIAPPTPPGFTSKEQLSDLGFATPDSAMLTFFWAMRETNVQRMVETWSDELKQRELQKDPASLEKLAKEFAKAGPDMMKHFHNIGVHQREEVSPTEHILHVQSSYSNKPMKMHFVLEGNEWKIRKMFE